MVDTEAEAVTGAAEVADTVVVVTVAAVSTEVVVVITVEVATVEAVMLADMSAAAMRHTADTATAVLGVQADTTAAIAAGIQVIPIEDTLREGPCSAVSGVEWLSEEFLIPSGGPITRCQSQSGTTIRTIGTPIRRPRM